MNYYRLFERIGFKRKKEAMLPGSEYDYTNRKGTYVLKNHILSEVKGYESTHRYYTSWEYKINDELSIWINTFKMSSFTAYIIDTRPNDKYNIVNQIILDKYDRSQSLSPNIWEAILLSLPERYSYVSNQLLRKIQLDRLF
jgi:hypothetical protein